MVVALCFRCVLLQIVTNRHFATFFPRKIPSNATSGAPEGLLGG